MSRGHVTFATVFAAVLVTASTVHGVVAAEPLEIGVILSLTGQAAFIGHEEQTALAITETYVNGHGGVRGRPVHFVVSDDQSSPQVGIQLANALIAKKVPIFLGPSLAAVCAALIPIVRDNGPTMYCYTPGVHPVPGTYVFSALIGARDLALAMVRWSRLNGWTRIAVISSTDSSGADFDRGLDTALSTPENASVKVVGREHFAPTDLSVNAQIARIKAADPQVVFAWTTGSPFGTVLHGIHDVGLDAPIIGGNGNMIAAQLAQYASFLPPRLYFPGVRGLAQTGTRAGPIRDKQKIYFDGLAKAGAQVSVPSNQAWDATWLVLDAYRTLGFDATATQFRDYLRGVRGWVGIEGVYDFSDPEQRGLGVQTCVIDRFDAQRGTFVPVSGPGGTRYRPS